MLKEMLKRGLTRTAPKFAGMIRRVRHRRHVRWLERKTGLARLRDNFVHQHGHLVLGGPFEGMRYVERSVGSVAIPKLVGSYEEELHPWLREILNRGYRRIIDIGCAEGYYVVGLARALPHAEVFAFDTDPLARRLCADMCRLNDVIGRVHISGGCSAAELQKVIRTDCLVVCDCEGFETTLLDPERAPSLRQADILVELHGRDAANSILGRFRSTHDCSVVRSAARNPAAYACLNFLPVSDRALALSEMRNGEQEWAFLTLLRTA
jgi:hypothetical protein